ncbi:EAL domain-containing protein [Coralliovum pocilloporae]|uniref:EAL domain-containing protein n=1 Tax=Coralliovum pocilloporae TaxID=3066369 RepID=UPI00330796B7
MKTLSTTVYSVRTLIAAGLFSLASGLFLMLTATEVSDWVSEQFAERSAETYATVIMDIQNFYSDAIVKHGKRTGIRIERDYRTSETPTIPFPASFTIDLTRNLSKRYEDLQFRYYSDYSFREAADGTPRDQFENDALSVLSQGKTDRFQKLDTINGQTVFRLAQPIRMEQGCVDCHNTIAGSPKTDWKVGEIRGVLGVTVPVQNYSIWSIGELGSSIYLVLGLYALLSALVFFAFLFMTKYQQERFQKNAMQEKNVKLKRAARQISELAYTDSVTQVGNRVMFRRELDLCLSRVSKQGKSYAIVLVDLDHFKNVNDSYGYEAGDFLLAEIANRLVKLAGPDGLVARLSGDEFALIITDHQDKQILEDCCRTARDILGQTVVYDGQHLMPSVSIGAVRTPLDGIDPDRLLVNAGHALRSVKAAGRHGFCVFDDALRHTTNRARDLGQRLQHAISMNYLTVHYQPKVCLTAGNLLGLEALMRWPDPEDGIIPPSEFIPVAERYGLVSELSELLFSTVGRDLKKWHSQTGRWIPVAVNLHPTQLRTSSVLRQLLNRLEETGVPRECLTLEITEDCVVGRGTEDVPRFLKELSSAGYRLSLDDFGTGFASLTHLMELPVAELKVDRDFTRKLGDGSGECLAIVKAIGDLSGPLNMDVVVEGIETVDQLTKITHLGLTIGQGFHFLPPTAFDVISALLRLKQPFRDRLPLAEPAENQQAVKSVQIRN